MIKSVFAAAAATSVLSAGAAFAGPYVNVESNSAFSGSDYSGTVLETHAGYEADLTDKVSVGFQGGPAIVMPDGGTTKTRISGKVFGTVAATDKLDFYGEAWAISADGDTMDTNLKVGAKYSF